MHDDALLEALRSLDSPAEPSPEFRRRLRSVVVSEARGPILRIGAGPLHRDAPAAEHGVTRLTPGQIRRTRGWAVAAAAFAVVAAVGLLTLWLTRDPGGTGVGGGLVFPSDRFPIAAASDGARLWVLAGHGDPGPDGLPWTDATLFAVDPATGDVTEVQHLADRPTLVAADATGVWVTHFETGGVTRIDSATGEILASIMLELPFDFGTGPDRRRFLPNDIVIGHGSVWVSTARGAVARVDSFTNTVIDLFELTPPHPQQLAVGPTGVWVAEDIHGLTHIDADTGAVSTLRVRAADSGDGVLNHSVGQVAIVDDQLYVMGHRPPLTVDAPRIVSHIDPETMQVVRTASIADGTTVFLGWIDGTFGVLDATGTFRRVVPGPDLFGEPFATNWDPGSGINQVGDQAWMMHRGESRMSRLTVTGPTDGPAPPFTLETYVIGDTVYVRSACSATDPILSGDPEGLPRSGQTTEDRVSTLATNYERLILDTFRAESVAVIPRNGDVITELASGDRSITRATDFQLRVELGASAPCPSFPHFWGGAPVLFTREAPPLVEEPEPVEDDHRFDRLYIRLGVVGDNVYVQSACPATNPTLRAGPDGADGLPNEETTTRDYVLRQIMNYEAEILGFFDGVAVRMIPRNGVVWRRTSTGQVEVVDAADFQIQVVLRADAACPQNVIVWGGLAPLLTRERPPSAPPSSVAPSARWFADGIGASGGTNLIGRGSLVLRDGPYVFVADGGGTVTALQTATGEPSWQQTLDGGNVVLLGVSSDSVLVGGYGVVTALDRATGAERWRSVDPDGLLWPMAAYSGRYGIHVLLDRPTEGDRDPPEVVTFNPVDGSVIWSRPLDGVDHPDLDIQTGPASSALVGDRLFVKTTGAMHAIDARSGETLWIHRFAAVPVESFWPAPLLVDGDLLYVPDPNGELVALEAASGRQRWRLEVGPGFVAPVSIEGGLVVFVDGGGVHAVEAATGDRVWDHPMTRAQAAVVGDVVVVLGRRRLTGLDAATGNAVWSASVNFDIPYAVLAVGDVAVAAAEDGVVAVVAETGAILWDLGRGAAEPPIVVDDEILIAQSDGRRTVAVYPMRPAE